MQLDIQREDNGLTTVPSEIIKRIEHLVLVLDELEQQRHQTNGLREQLAQVVETNDYLMLLLMMNEPMDISHKDKNERLRALSEQHIISLEQLEGYVLQQRERLRCIERELERLQADIDEQQRVLLTYHSRLEQLQRPASRS